MNETPQDQDRFCEERMRSGKATPLAELMSEGRLVTVGTRGIDASLSMIRELVALNCKNAFAIAVTAMVIRAPRTGKPVASPGEQRFTFNEIVLELPDSDEERRAVFRVVGPWVEQQGYDLPADQGQRFLYFRIE